MSYYSTKKNLDMGGFNTTGFNKYSLTTQTNNGVLPTTNYYTDKNDNKYCKYQSKFDDKDNIVNCIDCVSNYGFYGEKQFYCNGKCMSKHNLGQICSNGSLVSRNINQCFSPCYTSFPSTFGTQICTNDIDCNVNEICGSTGFCEPKPYIIGMSGMTGTDEIDNPYYNYADYSKFSTKNDNSGGYYYRPSMSGMSGVEGFIGVI